MMMRSFLGIALLVALVSANGAQAAPVTSGITEIPSIAIQDITLFAATNPNLQEDLTITDVTGFGTLRLNRDVQSGSTIEIPSLTGVYIGSHPALGNYRFGTLTADGEAAFSGNITNVVQDADDPGYASGSPSSFRSGEYQVSGAFFEFELLDTPAFFTTGAVTFNSEFDGLPPAVGTVIDGGNLPIAIFSGDTIIGVSTNRRIVTAVPEPSAALALSAFGAGLCGWAGRRKRRAALASR